MSGAVCPECGGRADVTRNPPRYTLPKLHGECRECGHGWNFNPPARDPRMVG